LVDSTSTSTKKVSELLVGDNKENAEKGEDTVNNSEESSNTNSLIDRKTTTNVVNDAQDAENSGKSKPIKVPKHTLKIKTIDDETKQGLPDADIEVVDSKGNVLFKGKSDQNGEAVVTVDNNGDKFYEVNAVHPDYMYKSNKIKVSDNVDEYSAIVNPHKIQIGYIEVLRHVYFDTDKSTLKPESFLELDKVVKVMNQNPYLKLEVNGHTDNVGTHDYNISLSQRRAEAVVHYLTSKGVSGKRLIAKGFGETRPIATNDDEEEGRELNRRTEVEVIK
jgi:outer membrane protein OmpA-like peptidoglycan-associated protein